MALFALLMAAAMAVTAGCQREPTEQEKQVMAELHHSLRAQCLGRFRVDLPDSFIPMKPRVTLYYGRDEYFKTIDVEIKNSNVTPEAMAKSVTARASELGAVINDETKRSNLLAQIKEGDDKTMLRYYSGSEGASGIDHELHLLVGHTHLTLTAMSSEGVPVTGKYVDLSADVEARIKKLAAGIHAVDDPEKAGPGFCLGPVVIDSDNDFERGEFTFDMKKHPDFTFTVSMSNQENAPDALLERMKVFDQYDGSGLSILRSHDLQFAGMPAQEKLAKITEEREQYRFVLESRPKAPSFAQEGTSVKLSTGNQLSDGRYLSSTLTQNEALSLWDAIIQSFRPRPNAVRAAANK